MLRPSHPVDDGCRRHRQRPLAACRNCGQSRASIRIMPRRIMEWFLVLISLALAVLLSIAGAGSNQQQVVINGARDGSWRDVRVAHGSVMITSISGQPDQP